MKRSLTLLFCLAFAATLFAQRPPEGPNPAPDAQYRLGPDSFPQEGVPKGRIDGPFVIPSEVYPGTQHTYWVYVPAQYDPATPAALMVYLDGQAYMNPDADLRAHNVMDNLIYRREIPVMIGVFINPGRTPEQTEPSLSDWGDRCCNRPAEYNTVDDKFGRIMVDELLPAIQKDYNISDDPAQHGIAGSSSGAIAAFTAAWFRPNHFRKVISFIGTFVNLGGRGGNRYPDMIVQADRKPLRVFLQDGRNDNRGMGRDGKYNAERDWFYNNNRMARALTEKGYDVTYVWGIGRHSQKQPGAILPEAMRWLWRDHPVSTDPDNDVERSFNEAAK